MVFKSTQIHKPLPAIKHVKWMIVTPLLGRRHSTTEWGENRPIATKDAFCYTFLDTFYMNSYSHAQRCNIALCTIVLWKTIRFFGNETALVLNQLPIQAWDSHKVSIIQHLSRKCSAMKFITASRTSFYTACSSSMLL